MHKLLHSVPIFEIANEFIRFSSNRFIISYGSSKWLRWLGWAARVNTPLRWPVQDFVRVMATHVNVDSVSDKTQKDKRSWRKRVWDKSIEETMSPSKKNKKSKKKSKGNGGEHKVHATANVHHVSKNAESSTSSPPKTAKLTVGLRTVHSTFSWNVLFCVILDIYVTGWKCL